MIKPVCGPQKKTVNTWWDKLKVWLLILAIISGIDWLLQVFGYGKVALEWFGYLWEFVFFGMSFWWAAFAAAIVTYIFGFYVFYKAWSSECKDDLPGGIQCVSGIVNEVKGEALNQILNPEHPWVNVVVKSKYWPLVNLNVDYITCSDALSPILKVVYKSSRICNIRKGSFIGAAVAGAVAVVPAAIAAAAIGCATVILCAIAILVAVLIVAAGLIIGAIYGGALGSATAQPDPASFDSGDPISAGDYISAQGPTAKNLHFSGAMVQQFNQETALLGRSANSAPYDYQEADLMIPDELEACPM